MESESFSSNAKGKYAYLCAWKQTENVIFLRKALLQSTAEHMTEHFGKTQTKNNYETALHIG